MDFFSCVFDWASDAAVSNAVRTLVGLLAIPGAIWGTYLFYRFIRGSSMATQVDGLMSQQETLQQQNERLQTALAAVQQQNDQLKELLTQIIAKSDALKLHPAVKREQSKKTVKLFSLRGEREKIEDEEAEREILAEERRREHRANLENSDAVSKLADLIDTLAKAGNVANKLIPMP